MTRSASAFGFQSTDVGALLVIGQLCVRSSITTSANAIHDYLESVPWGVLFDAHGRATPLKKFLLDLHTGAAEQKDEAIYDGLWGHAIHQGSWYSATLFTIPAVVMALRGGAEHGAHELLGFLCCSVRIGTWRLRQDSEDSGKILVSPS